MEIVPAIVCGLVGLVVGGLIEPLVQRTPLRERMRVPAPHCMRCGEVSSGAQVSPWTARLTKRNTCRTCGQNFWTSFPWLEVGCAAFFAVVAGHFGWAWALPAYLLFAFSTISLSVIDIKHHLLPNRIIYPTLFVALVLLALAALAQGNGAPLLRAIIGMAGASLFFFVVWFIYPKGMGFGDVRLSLLVGLFTGWMGIGNTFIGVLAGLILGAVSGVAFVAFRFIGMRDPIPYGPFLLAGAFISIFFGSTFAPALN